DQPPAQEGARRRRPAAAAHRPRHGVRVPWQPGGRVELVVRQEYSAQYSKYARKAVVLRQKYGTVTGFPNAYPARSAPCARTLAARFYSVRTSCVFRLIVSRDSAPSRSPSWSWQVEIGR